MSLHEKVAKIAAILDSIYPAPPIPLHYADPFTLLIAVVLSAQCTDRRVNEVTPRLFARAATPEAMQRVPYEELLDIIHTCGLGPTKARNIIALSHLLVEQHQSLVPNTFAALEALPGVGHKTASVILAQAFDIPTFPVDTHIHRLARRWGLSSGHNVKTTETDLKHLFPPNTWLKRHLQFIHFGRDHCPARRHDPSQCPICSWVGETNEHAR